MSGFRLKAHRGTPPPPIPPSSPAITKDAEASGIPQVGQSWAVYAPETSIPATNYRFNLQKIDPTTLAVVSTTSSTQTGDSYFWTRPGGDADYAFGVTVDVSFDGGSTFPLTSTATLYPNYWSDVILPAIIPDPAIVWNSGTSKWDITGKLYAACQLLLKIETQNFTSVSYFGAIAIPETSRNTPYSLDLSGATDPAPDPIFPTINPTDNFSVQQITPDYQWDGDRDAFIGSASNWATASQTFRSGIARIRVSIPSPGGSNSFAPELQWNYGGINILQSIMPDGTTMFGRALRSSLTGPVDIRFQGAPLNFVGGTSNLGSLQSGEWIELDLNGVNIPSGASTFVFPSVDPYHPFTDFTMQVWDASGTLINTITRSGLTYASNGSHSESL